MGSLMRDARVGIRTLAKSPGFTIVAVLSLALGIGANTAIFELLDSVRMRSLPVPEAQRLGEVRLVDGSKRRGSVEGWNADFTYPLWETLRDHAPAAFAGLVAWADGDFNIGPVGEVRRAQGLWVSGDFFQVLRVEPILGRVFDAGDDRRGCGLPGAVISYAFWQREFAGDPAALGKQITLEYHPVEIIGVTPPTFTGLEVGQSFDVAVPICSQPALDAGNSLLDDGTKWWLTVVGRLTARATIQQATAELGSLSPALFAATVPTTYPKLLLTGSGSSNRVWADGSDPQRAVDLDFDWVSRGFFTTMGIPLVGGRDFDDRDTPTSAPVAIVNEAFARRLGLGSNPIGQRFRREATPSDPEMSFEIVGLVGDSRYRDIYTGNVPIAYLATSQDARFTRSFLQVLVRSHAPPAAITPRVRDVVRGVSPLATVEFAVYESMIRDSLLRERLMAALSGFFGLLAALLVTVGVYGVMSYLVARRTNEIGIRMTLGADRKEVIRLIIREAGVLIGAGVGVGLVIAIGASFGARAMVYGVRSYDPLTLAAAIALLVMVAFAASYLPARRAARLDPAIALRET